MTTTTPTRVTMARVAIAEIFQRVREKLARNQGMPGNNCLIYFDSLNVHGDTYDGNVMAAQVGNTRGPWKARIYLRLQMDFTDSTPDGAIDGLERIITEWANSEAVRRVDEVAERVQGEARG